MQMMTRKNNVATRESNDNIDHKNVVIENEIALQMKENIFLIACIKEIRYSTIFYTSIYFDHIFGPKTGKLFCSVFVFRKGMSNATCDLVLYLGKA